MKSANFQSYKTNKRDLKEVFQTLRRLHYQWIHQNDRFFAPMELPKKEANT